MSGELDNNEWLIRELELYECAENWAYCSDLAMRAATALHLAEDVVEAKDAEIERLRAETALLMEVLTTYGDLLINDWDEEYEGWSASLHDTSRCSCHADTGLCCKTCGDPINITKEQRDLLVRFGVRVEEAPRER